MQVLTGDFPSISSSLRAALIQAPRVDVGEWQAIRGGPRSLTVEIEDVSIDFELPGTKEQLAEEVKPNLPWAEDHFQERVSGFPLNPPPSADWWPHNVRGNEMHKARGQFSHTYPERLWPKQAGMNDPLGIYPPRQGIRYPYGDLMDAVALLAERPGTRQAYVPIWFPEDTGATAGQRVPCTLGYHLMIRSCNLKIVYYIRSCDFLRHFHDDVYLASRLCQWVANEVRERGGFNVQPGRLVMHISSLHVFAADVPILIRRKEMKETREFQQHRG